ncbi:Calx-beta domain-containing protein, partial [Trichocoleus sp. DQ-U1]|uniref:Calx-beta domain-containing protein n=1 Tax=Trichocoleus sp. DQ-U1 TaxID=2933926 RepID=UPI0032994403
GILTFNPGEPLTKTITVNVKGDNKFEADETFSIKLNSATNANLGNTTATGIIKNDETAGFTVTPISGNTTEAGGTATFTVKLNSQPTANVTLGLTSSDTTEGTVSSPSLTFTANNWNIAQTVTVKGVDDALVDGNIAYNIITTPGVSTDLNYNKLNPVDVAVTNIDNDAAGFTITPISGNTTEAGGAANFTVKLNSQPTANVTLGLGSSDPTEGSVSSPSLTFTSNNWNIAQTITVKGVDDVLVDGNIAYSIVTAPAISTDAKYNGLNPQDVAVVNIDNDTAPLNVINGTWLSETLVGTSLDDRINGFGGHDTIVGGLGKDRIYGDDGNDTLIGDLNNNLLTGGSMGMDDIIYGGTGSDRINGCGGNDTLYGEAGSDQIWGDGGDDRLYGGLGNDILTGGLGRDIFAVSKGEGTDTIRDFQIGQDYIGLGGGLKLNQLSIIQQGSNTSIIDNSNNQTLAILAGVNAATFMSNAASTFVSI